MLPETMPALAAVLPDKPDYHTVQGAAHFAFLAPCSEQLTKNAPQICVDGQGFDRVTFHRAFAVEAIAFFKAHLR